MTNAQIILGESLDLMEQGILKGSGVTSLVKTADGTEKEIELPEPIHTYQRWQELGYQVRKGEHAIAKFMIWKQGKASKKAMEEAEANGETPRTRMFMKTAAFFKADQCDKIEMREAV
jgi:antirestriction protein ArdC